MQVVLLEPVDGLGKIGSIVHVKPGFARNFLIPRKKALAATKNNLVFYEKLEKQLKERDEQSLEKAKSLASSFSKLNLVFIRHASESGNLFGSVRPKDILDGILTNTSYATLKDVLTQSSQVRISSPIKILGIHKVKVFFHPEISVDVFVNIARSEEEADLQEKKEMFVDEHGVLSTLSKQEKDESVQHVTEASSFGDDEASEQLSSFDDDIQNDMKKTDEEEK